jgi:tRNA (guanine-N7-)-methyltransferase
MRSARPSPEKPAARELVYGRRQGRRLRVGQAGLLADRLPRLAIRLEEAVPLDPGTLFETPPRAVWLEVGFGGGEHLAAQAAAHPAVGFIGAEIFVNGQARLIAHMEEAGLGNIRIWPDDAKVLMDALAEASIDRLFLLFPDPWPKTRHARRRFIGPENLRRIARCLADGGELRLATDDPVFLDWALEHLVRDKTFQWTARGPQDWRTRPADWPATRYEAKALAAGRRPVFLRFQRRPRGSAG